MKTGNGASSGIKLGSFGDSVDFALGAGPTKPAGTGVWPREGEQTIQTRKIVSCSADFISIDLKKFVGEFEWFSLTIMFETLPYQGSQQIPSLLIEVTLTQAGM